MYIYILLSKGQLFHFQFGLVLEFDTQMCLVDLPEQGHIYQISQVGNPQSLLTNGPDTDRKLQFSGHYDLTDIRIMEV